MVADDHLRAARWYGSVTGLGKNKDEPERKRVAHVWVPVHGHNYLVVNDHSTVLVLSLYLDVFVSPVVLLALGPESQVGRV
jgi:hypothetical protein